MGIGKQLSADTIIKMLFDNQSDKEAKNIASFYNGPREGNKIIGVRMKTIFDIAKENSQLSIGEVEKLLDSPYYDARMVAVSVMDFQARNKKLPESRRKALFDIYINKHDRINDWGLVDRSAPFVLGRYLADKSRDILYDLAQSKDPWRRRSATTATLYFCKYGKPSDVTAVLGIDKILMNDSVLLVSKAAGIALKYARRLDEKATLSFLKENAAHMSKATLSIAISKLDETERKYER